MPTVVGILTLISRINTTSESLKARKVNVFQHFSCNLFAMHAASQLPGRGPTNVDDASSPAC